MSLNINIRRQVSYKTSISAFGISDPRASEPATLVYCRRRRGWLAGHRNRHRHEISDGIVVEGNVEMMQMEACMYEAALNVSK
jgi:hypothetical protein